MTVEEWNYDEEHVHILFRFVPNIDLSKIILMNSLRKTNYEMSSVKYNINEECLP
ncbi:transposase [Bacillus mycoides]|nr:transposase [Bacillus mycoides]MDM5428518.1 transposase [Bacillus mycoides]